MDKWEILMMTASRFLDLPNDTKEYKITKEFLDRMSALKESKNPTFFRYNPYE